MACDQLPSERELAETFKVSRTSVREALRALENQGLIVSRTGMGNFVVDLPLEALVGPLALSRGFRPIALFLAFGFSAGGRGQRRYDQRDYGLTINQLSTPDALRGPMASINSIFTNSGPQLGQFEAGLLASLIVGTERSATTDALLILVIVIVMGVRFPLVHDFRNGGVIAGQGGEPGSRS
jgi:hypothetical protein